MNFDKKSSYDKLVDKNKHLIHEKRLSDCTEQSQDERLNFIGI